MKLLINMIFIMIGIISLFLSAILFAVQYKQINQSQIISGVVVDFHQPSAKSQSVAIIVEYQLDGASHRFKSDFASYPSSHEIGDKVDVFLNVKNNKVKKQGVFSFWGVYGIATSLLLLGLNAVVIGMISLWWGDVLMWRWHGHLLSK